MARLASSARTRSAPRRGSSRRSSSGSTEWVATAHFLTLTWDTLPWAVFNLIPNEVATDLTDPTYLGGFFDVVVTAIDVPPAVPPAQASFAIGVRPLPLRTYDAAVELQGGVGGTAAPDRPIPLPWTDGEGNWSYLRYGYVSTAGSDLAVHTDNHHDDLSLVRIHDMARSKRKLASDELLAGVVEIFGAPTLPPTGNVCFAIHARLLLRQP